MRHFKIDPMRSDGYGCFQWRESCEEADDGIATSCLLRLKVGASLRIASFVTIRINKGTKLKHQHWWVQLASPTIATVPVPLDNPKVPQER